MGGTRVAREGEGALLCRPRKDHTEKDIAEEHLRAIRSVEIVTAEMVDSNGKVKCMVHQ